MRFKTIIFVIVYSLFTISCSHGGTDVLHDTRGNSLSPSSFSGKWVVLSYWADWCGNCVEETPALNRFAQDIKGKNVLFYGVNYDHKPGAELTEAMAKMKITYPVLRDDPGQIWHLRDPGALPVTFIINPEGDVVKTILGANTEQSLLNFLHEAQLNENQ